MAQARQLVLTDEQYRDLLDCRDHHPKAYAREKAAAILKVEASASGAAGRRERRPIVARTSVGSPARAGLSSACGKRRPGCGTSPCPAEASCSGA